VSWHPDVSDIQGLVDGELDAHARRGVEAHLQSCAACGATAARLLGVAAALRAVPRATVPAGLHDRILSAVAAAPRVVEPACAECAEMASVYVDGELSGAERDAFEAHVFGCPKCFAALKQTERAAELLRTTPRRPAPADLCERITAAVAAEHGAAVRFTWRRVVGVAAGVAAAAAVVAALLIPGAQAPDPGTAPAVVIAEQPAEAGSTEPVVAAAPVGEPSPPAAMAATEIAAGARTTHVAEAPRTARASAGTTAPPSAGHTAETRVAEAPAVVTPPRALPTEDTHPVTTPASAPRLTPRPRPAPAPAAAELAPAPQPAVTRPAPAPAPPAETAIALAARTTGPDARGAGPVAAPAPPVPVPAAANGNEEPVRLASLVPQQRGARTLYRAPSEPATGAIDRARNALARGQSSAFDDPRTGIELR